MASLAVATGARGPPNELAVLGASNYLAEVRPGSSHARYQRLHVASPAVDARGRLMDVRSRPVMMEAGEAAASVAEALAATKTLAADSEPVRVRDLHEVAARTTAELVEKEKEVGGPEAAGWGQH